MKTELLRKYFKKILEGTNGNNSSNSDIIDYENGTSISIAEIEEEYKKYIDLQEEIDEYIENNYLDNVLDKEAIKKHFSEIDEDLFEFNQAILKEFDEYMIIKINKNNKNIRKANLMFNKNGNGSTTTRISIPVPWAKELGFTEGNKTAIIKLMKDEIIIKKGGK